MNISAAIGRPGSSFALTASNLPPNAAASLTINGQTVVSQSPAQSLGSDDRGILRFALTTSAADPGFYAVELQVEGVDSPLILGLVLKPEAPLHNSEIDNGLVLNLPAGTARTLYEQFLPVVIE
ncbi:MAG: hypothetical protein HC822_20280 [Oscillochloris sp.]|nr:hypothetical protein [Oscillochloris sp.]